MTTTAKVDDRRRIRIPDAKPGQLVSVQSTEDGWKVTPIKLEADEAFPRGSLLKYLTPAYKKEQLQILRGCVFGPDSVEPNE